MKVRKLARREIDPADYVGRVPLKSEMGELVTQDLVVECEGRVVLVYTIIDPEVSRGIRLAAESVRYSRSARTNGMPMQSALFGSAPRIAIRNDYCRKTAATVSEPKNWSLIKRFGDKLSQVYRQWLPEEYERQSKLVEQQVGADWQIAGMPFTTVILNRNQALKYHLDSGNFKGLYSNVFILRRAAAGGQLVLPSLASRSNSPIVPWFCLMANQSFTEFARFG